MTQELVLLVKLLKVRICILHPNASNNSEKISLQPHFASPPPHLPEQPAHLLTMPPQRWSPATPQNCRTWTDATVHATKQSIHALRAAWVHMPPPSFCWGVFATEKHLCQAALGRQHKPFSLQLIPSLQCPSEQGNGSFRCRWGELITGPHWITHQPFTQS